MHMEEDLCCDLNETLRIMLDSALLQYCHKLPTTTPGVENTAPLPILLLCRSYCLGELVTCGLS